MLRSSLKKVLTEDFSLSLFLTHACTLSRTPSYVHTLSLTHLVGYTWFSFGRFRKRTPPSKKIMFWSFFRKVEPQTRFGIGSVIDGKKRRKSFVCFDPKMNYSNFSTYLIECPRCNYEWVSRLVKCLLTRVWFLHQLKKFVFSRSQGGWMEPGTITVWPCASLNCGQK